MIRLQSHKTYALWGSPLLVFMAHALIFVPQAHAQTDPADMGAPCGPVIGECFALPIKTVNVPIDGGSFDIKVAEGNITYVRFPERVELRDARFVLGGFDFDEDKEAHSITVATTKSLRVGDAQNLVLLTGHMDINMNVRMTGKEDEYDKLIFVNPLPREEYERRKAEQEEQARLRDASALLAYRKQVAHTLLEFKELRIQRPQVAQERAPNSPASEPVRSNKTRAILSWALSVDGERYWLVTIDNQKTTEVTIESATLSHDGKRGMPAEIAWEQSARLEGSKLIVPPKHQTRGMVLIPKTLDEIELGAMSVHFLAPGNLPMLTAKQIVEIYPMPQEEYRRRRRAAQTTVSVRALFGGFWTTAGDDLGGLDGTAIAGAGARIQKGYGNGFAMEGEFVVGRTGDARFDDMSWDGMTGNITRSATLVRAMGGAAMRFGTDYVFTGRMGVGVQLAGYDSAFVMGGAPMDGPGDGLEVDGVWSVGAGFDARLGTHWALGAAATFADAFNTGSRSLEAGLHLGYGWN